MGEVVRLRRRRPSIGRVRAYAAAVAMVVLATASALAAEPLLASADLAVAFVLPVLIAGLSLGRGPAITAAALSVLADDVFLIEPRLSLTVASRADAWTLTLLLLVGLIASHVASLARRRALQSERERAHAQALLHLAEQVLQGRTERRYSPRGGRGPVPHLWGPVARCRARGRRRASGLGQFRRRGLGGRRQRRRGLGP